MAGTIKLALGPLEHWNNGNGSAYWRPLPQTGDAPRVHFGMLEAVDGKLSPSPLGDDITLVPLLAAPLQNLSIMPVCAFRPPANPDDLPGQLDLADAADVSAIEAIPNGSAAHAMLNLSHTMSATLVNPNYDATTDTAPPTDPARLPAASIDGKAQKLVIVGVIDDGLPFAHRHFRASDETKTRIDYVWLQASAGAEGKQETVPFGTELSGADIEALIAQHGRDEEAIYRDKITGAVTTPGADDSDMEVGTNILRNYTHGANVMDQAAGFSSTDVGGNHRDRARVIAVQLPRSALRDTTGFTKDAFILSGVHYILGRAQNIIKAYHGETSESTPKMDVLINISLGTSGGPKDGSYILERALDEVAATYSSDASAPMSVEIALPSGNSFAEQLYAESPWPETHGHLTVPWRIQPNDRTSSMLEIWLDGTDQWDLETLNGNLDWMVHGPPGSGLSGAINLGPQAVVQDSTSVLATHDVMAGRTVIGQLSFDRRGADNWRTSLILAPTEHQASYQWPDAPSATPGRWTVEITASKAANPSQEDNLIRFAIHRDEDPADTDNGGRQSYFDFNSKRNDIGLFTARGQRDPRMAASDDQLIYDPVDNLGRGAADEAHPFIKPFGSINGWATGTADNPYRSAVAGFTAALDDSGSLMVEEAALYASAGRILAGGSDPKSRVKFSAISNRDRHMPGVRGAGTKSGATTVLVGTSAAAPLYTRARMLSCLMDTAMPFDINAPSSNRLGEPVLFTRQDGAASTAHAPGSEVA